MEQLQIQTQEIKFNIINGFCYPFAKALLKKLLELKRDGRVIENGQLIEGSIGFYIVHSLIRQLNGTEESWFSVSFDHEDLANLIDVAEEFLKIIEDIEQ